MSRLDARFWSKVEKRGPDECWMWKAGVDVSGYGRIAVDGRAVKATHLVLADIGAARIGKAHALHSCDNRRCVNPSHLRWGNNADNVADKVKRGRAIGLSGEKNPRAKLTANQVQAIRFAQGRCADIAKQFCVSKSLVGQIKQGIIWTCVPFATEKTA